MAQRVLVVDVGWYSFEDFGDRPADAAKDRFGTKDDQPG
jgi:hypothetical protein